MFQPRAKPNGGLCVRSTCGFGAKPSLYAVLAMSLFSPIPCGAVYADDRDAIWERLRKYAEPPAEFAGQLGPYRSPLKFADGSAVKSAADWPRRRQEILDSWHRRLGAWPTLVERPDVKRLETVARDGYTQHHVHVQIKRDGKLADGYLLVPDGRGPFPAVFVPFYEPQTSIGDGANGRGRGTHDYGLQLVRRGFVTLSIGTPGSVENPGPETRQLLNAAGIEQARQPLSYLAYVAANGHTALAQMPEVDAARIGIIGLSYGGKWSMFASCLHDKFACAVWSDPGIVFNEKNANVNYWEPWYLGYEPGRQRKPGIPSSENPRTGLYKQLIEAGDDLVDLHALMAPRPLLVSGGTEDPPQNWRALNHLVAVNELLGHKQRVAMTARPTHVPTAEALELELLFLEYWLKRAPQDAVRADTVLLGGKIVTFDGDERVVEALAIRDGRVLAAGPNGEIEKLIGERTEVVRLGGKMVLPGFIETHCHAIGVARDSVHNTYADLSSIAEIQDWIRRRAKEVPAGEWIEVPRNEITRLKERRHPTPAELDAACSTHPVLYTSVLKHVLNSAAFRAIGVVDEKSTIAGGEIVRDADGRPVLVRGGTEFIRKHMSPAPAVSREETLDALAKLLRRYNEVGITSIFERATDRDGVEIFRELHKQGRLTTRVTATFRFSARTADGVEKYVAGLGLRPREGDDWVRAGPLKITVDGGIHWGTTRLSESYGPRRIEFYRLTDPNYRGEQFFSVDEMTTIFGTGTRLGWQMSCHVTGDDGTERVLDAVEAVAKSDSTIRDRRFTLIHSYFPSPAIVRRAKELGVCVDTQGYLYYKDADVLADIYGTAWAERFIGLGDWVRAGVPVALNSDHMNGLDPDHAMNSFNPMLMLYVAASRKTQTGRVHGPHQRLSRLDALRTVTTWAAQLSFDESNRGSLEPGRLADLVVIDRDYLTCAEQEIRDIRVLRTIVGGKTVFERAAATSSGSRRVDAVVADDPVDLGRVTEKHVMIPMRDGVWLSAYLYFPPGDGPWPVLFEQRYADLRAAATRKAFARLAEAGYVVCAENFRGAQQSEGTWVGYRALGWGERQDGYDTVEWLAAQSWSAGKVGTLGSSQAGYAQNFLAVTQPPHLTCQYMIDTGLSLFHEGYRIGGTARPERFKQMDAVCRDPADNRRLMDEWFRHATYDDYWAEEDCTRHFDRMNVPCFTIGSWYDFMNVGSIESFRGRQHRGGPQSRGRQQLLIGPWLHGGYLGKNSNKVGELTYPDNARFDAERHMLRWFDHYLKGIDNGVEREPSVRYYVMGAAGDPDVTGNVWREADDWPMPSDPTSYYLLAGGRLATQQRESAEAATTFLADPLKPNWLPGRAFPGAADARKFEAEPEVRTFTTEPLADPVEWTGLVRADLFVSSTARDNDFIVRVSDVYPDGRSILLIDYIRRARYRDGYDREAFMEPGHVYKVAFDVGWLSQIFARGHRIRVTVASTGAPFYEPNPNTGESLTIDGPEKTVVAKNELHHDRNHWSRIIAPLGAGQRAQPRR